MNILIAPDSFKGSLSTSEAAEAIARGARRVWPEASFACVPVADGGEGTLDCVLSFCAGERQNVRVSGPLGAAVDAQVGILDDGTAILEMASASGLTLIPAGARDVFRASSFGTGTLIRAALDAGARKIFVGIGGSATNDGGAGMLQALGFSLKDAAGRELCGGAGALSDIASIDVAGADARIFETEFEVMCDVTNPLLGENGASAVFGPQKGARPEDVPALDAALARFADATARALGRDLRAEAGGGAAGGMGFALMAFLNAKMRPGIDVVLDLARFDEKLADADLVLTGEGNVDSQSVSGKVISGIARRAAAQNVPVIVLGGGLSADARLAYDAGIAAMEASVCRPMGLEEAVTQAADLLAGAAERVLRAVRLGARCGENFH